MSAEALVRAALQEYGRRASPQAAGRMVDLVAAGGYAIQVIVEIQSHEARISAGFFDGNGRTELADVVVPVGVRNE